MIRSKVITPPTGHLFTIEECREQCEVVPIDIDSDGDLTHPNDALLLGYLDAAVEYAENFLGFPIAVRTYEAALECFPDGKCPITLPDRPLVDVLSLTYGHVTSSDAVSDSGSLDIDIDYFVDDFGQFAKLIPVDKWPKGKTIRIVYVAGYLDDSDHPGVPRAIRQAIMLTLGDWYLNREDSLDAEPYPLPNGAMSLLRPLRVRLGMA